jgi:hypothetical protein
MNETTITAISGAIIAILNTVGIILSKRNGSKLDKVRKEQAEVARQLNGTPSGLRYKRPPEEHQRL